MQSISPIYTANMTDHQRSWFYAEYQHASREEVVGVLLALFLGCFGIHHFYVRRNGLGILYLLLCWTGISAILGFIDAFFMPGRVRRYNAQQAAYIASQFNNIMDLLQLIMAFVNAPVFATFLLGMFWKRTTGHGAFTGLAPASRWPPCR